MANITFGSYEPSEERDDGVQDIIFGMFFDGTLNNERNTYIRKEYEKKKKKLAHDKDAAKDYPFIKIDADSYDNDYSNVARMYRFYDNGAQQSIYIEGIGTDNGKSSDVPDGYLTGMGMTGIDEKVKKACEEAVKKMLNGGKVNLIFDVFGFSRGAAAARYFIHQITKERYKTFWGTQKPKRGYLGEELQKFDIEVGTFEIRFVGLYDTVSSYGYNFNDDVDDLKLDSIKHSSVKNVIQLAAGHEWRKNFNLTTIESALHKGKQLIIPGAHADVGGCYENGTFKQYHNESVVPGRVINDQSVYNQLANEKRQKYINAGWYRDKEIVIGPHSNKYVNHIGLNGTRYIDKRYSYIPLQFMCQLAKNKKSEFKTDELKRPKNFEVPEKTNSGQQHILDYAKNKLKLYVDAAMKADSTESEKISYKNYLDFTNEKILINGYVHWSATNKLGHEPRENNIRKKIPG